MNIQCPLLVKTGEPCSYSLVAGLLRVPDLGFDWKTAVLGNSMYLAGLCPVYGVGGKSGSLGCLHLLRATDPCSGDLGNTPSIL